MQTLACAKFFLSPPPSLVLFSNSNHPFFPVPRTFLLYPRPSERRYARLNKVLSSATELGAAKTGQWPSHFHEPVVSFESETHTRFHLAFTRDHTSLLKLSQPSTVTNLSLIGITMANICFN